MIDETIINEIFSLTDSDKGGDNALDGFEFQLSSAIYLMFSEIKKSNKFFLIYEKLEDFIIINESIHLYQAKSINRNLTPNVLYKPTKKTKKNSNTLSIIEKMQDNYLSIKKIVSKCDIDNNLIICENQSFTKKLTNKIKNINEQAKFNFDELEPSVKQEIISNTKHDNYAWNRINAIRLIPKSRHEEVTRSYIMDVINERMGENKINCLALYNSLSNEIRRIRKFKITLTSDFLIEQIGKFSSFENAVNYRDYVHLLNNSDQKSIIICQHFNIMRNTIMIPNHPDCDDYERLKNVLLNENYFCVDDIYDVISRNDDFHDMIVRSDEYKLKALILLVVAKEAK